MPHAHVHSKRTSNDEIATILQLNQEVVKMSGRSGQFTGAPKGQRLGSQKPQYIHGYMHCKVKSQTERRSLGNSVHVALLLCPVR